MRYPIILLGLLTILSCENSDKEKKLFGTLYNNKFSIGEITTIEFVDSTFYVILSGSNTIDGITLGLWRPESNLFGTSLFSKTTVDSVHLKVLEISNDLVKFKLKNEIIEFKKVVKKEEHDLSGNWKCLGCAPLPPLRTSESNALRVVNYIFRNDDTFVIEEEDWRAKGVWRLSNSGQFIILNNIYKTGDVFRGDLLLINSVKNDTLTLSRVDTNGDLIVRELVKDQNLTSDIILD